MRFTTMSMITSFLLFSLSIHLQADVPIERITISCGSTTVSSDGERTWVGDKYNSSKFLLSPEGTVVAAANTQFSTPPFDTARLSLSQFTYSFPVSPGTKFLRLFFFPDNYSHFARANASFTVKSGEYTLLHNFNTSLNADAKGKAIIIREYIMRVKDGQRLNLTFIPTKSQYAFVNGIEVLSMPSDLYYATPPRQQFPGNSFYSIGSDAALETAYRINIGGEEIRAGNDTGGLLRKWDNSDEPYFMTPGARDVGIYGTMNITVNPNYLAPVELYRTARDMGTNGKFNKTMNLTWEFPVDVGFFYMLRLHFCELYPQIKQNKRVFFIYIAGELAEKHADIMKWSDNQKGVTVQTDYVVSIPKHDNHKFSNLSLQLDPYKGMRYSGPILNGLEIFKISDADSNNLAGPNPNPIEGPPSPSPIQSPPSPSSIQSPPNPSPVQSPHYSSALPKIRPRPISMIAGVVSGVVFVSIAVSAAVLIRRGLKSKSKTNGNLVNHCSSQHC